ncbi:fumarase, putative [Eimeria tenella]|uniref:fumarate hydratase n=1 Tax=Eimeria tenella TaxID=5802 RepID=U6KZM0_EIMTE|nr:fumarase, putative [Eimeria tenella]CDJ42383.1 fumarase, putative [Eimeria tenella]|eukprot:XP_013233133.1 fumarase, putative [Eimeria tenella]
MNACTRCVTGCAAAAFPKAGSRGLASAAAAAVPFHYSPLFQHSKEPKCQFRRLDTLSNEIRAENVTGLGRILRVPASTLTALSREAFGDLAHLLRPSHLQQLRNILDDKDSSVNDRAVALELLKNACIAAGRVLPGCQDTGTAIVVGKKGQFVFTEGADEEALSKGAYLAYTTDNLRYSQMAPLDMFTEQNTKCNLPAQVDIAAVDGSSYEFLFIAKGGGSANKTFLYQQTKGLLTPAKLYAFLEEKIRTIGTSACPPYHLAVVIGGLSAEQTLKTVKLASCRYLDSLPTSGNEHGRAFRDLEMEEKILNMTREIGIGAQFGGRYFCHDVRIIRLPRHGASLPVGIGVSCSADRQALAVINEDGVFLEQLETDPTKYLPSVTDSDLGITEPVRLSLDQPMSQLLQALQQLPCKTRLSLSGTLIVARDIAHAKLMERLEKEGDLPEYFKQHPIYYAGPAKTPEGRISGSFGPTTAGRMDPYVPAFMAKGGSMVTLAKGNRSAAVAEACKKYGGAYLGSIGGPAARIAENCIKEVEVVEYPELGMEAVWRIRVEDFPAFVVIDTNGNDFYKTWMP